MTQEQFDIAFKRFTRFLKEIGYYTFTMKYLFPSGRTKQDLFREINSKTYYTNFSGLLGYVNLLGPSYKKYGHEYWRLHIRELDGRWYKECKEIYPEYCRRL